MKKDRRTYFRINLEDRPLCSTIRIKLVNNHVVNSAAASVCIMDMSASGLRFSSHLDFPVVKHCLFQFTIKILNKDWELLGSIVRKHKVEDTLSTYYEYGVNFKLNDEQQKDLFQDLNKLNIQLNKILFANGCIHCPKKSIDLCFHERNLKRISATT